jgi:ubiquinone/menaquinone biosynthesis C-methylase UbiE
LSLEQWETYYRGGAIATGPTGPDGLYDLEVRRAWVGFFSSLPTEARLLDIATGNGVIPLIALEVARSRGAQWTIDATDLARIDPTQQVADGAERFAGVRFHPAVASEKLPFEDASFDAVSGHYALEYSDTAAALAQVHRVLKPGGDAQFVTHHAGSVLIESARRSMADCDVVLKQVRLYRRVHRLVTLDSAPEATLKAASDELVAGLRVVREAHATAEARQPGSGRVFAVAIDAAQKLLAARRTMKPALVGLEVDRAEEELRASWRRLNDLVGHALDDAGIAAVQQQATALGFTLIECHRLYHAGENLVGWQLTMHRP